MFKVEVHGKAFDEFTNFDYYDYASSLEWSFKSLKDAFDFVNSHFTKEETFNNTKHVGFIPELFEILQISPELQSECLVIGGIFQANYHADDASVDFAINWVKPIYDEDQRCKINSRIKYLENYYEYTLADESCLRQARELSVNIPDIQFKELTDEYLNNNKFKEVSANNYSYNRHIYLVTA